MNNEEEIKPDYSLSLVVNMKKEWESRFFNVTSEFSPEDGMGVMEATEMVMYSSRMVSKLLVALASQLAMKQETVLAMYITELKDAFVKETTEQSVDNEVSDGGTDVVLPGSDESSDGGTDENLSDKTIEQWNSTQQTE